VVFRAVVPDDVEAVRDAFRRAAAAVGQGVVLSTGGTGFSPRDTTPEAVAPLLSAAFPGVNELLRRDGRSRTPTAVLSRGVAGRIGDALAVTLPGSARAVAEGCDALEPVLAGMLSLRLLVW
jgi:molybdenum cofactor synthesis domain-containing protein